MVEPVVASIINWVRTLQHKGISTTAMSRAASTKKSANFQCVFQSSNLPSILFRTPEYLFGTPSSASYISQFQSFLSNKGIFCIVAIDETQKVFDCMPDY